MVLLIVWLADEYGGWCAVWVVSVNGLGAEGAKALGPHVAKLLQLQTLNLSGTWLQLS